MEDTYAARVSQQIQQYVNTGALWKLPPIYSYWNRRYIAPRLEAVSGQHNIFDIYFEAIAAAASAKNGERAVLYSIGAGDGTVEVQIAKRLKVGGIGNARVVCLELSPVRLDRARKSAEWNDVTGLMEFVETDLNSWQAPEEVDVFLAHHTLHHLVELEKIFESIKAGMTQDSVFLTADMIGRNGHRRWPETLEWIDQIWATMPSRYKLNFQFNEFHEKYLDWDCSTSGFEGIRAQDVLPEIVKRFGFDWYIGYGGIIDPFIERGYGQNFDPDNREDTAFIDLVEHLNQTLLETGRITPTMMMAAFRKNQGQSRAVEGITPERSVRAP